MEKYEHIDSCSENSYYIAQKSTTRSLVTDILYYIYVCIITRVRIKMLFVFFPTSPPFTFIFNPHQMLHGAPKNFLREINCLSSSTFFVWKRNFRKIHRFQYFIVFPSLIFTSRQKRIISIMSIIWRVNNILMISAFIHPPILANIQISFYLFILCGLSLFLVSLPLSSVQIYQFNHQPREHKLKCNFTCMEHYLVSIMPYPCNKKILKCW